MSSKPAFSSFEVLSFDCYGTLIDWETGLFNALSPLNNRLSTPLSRHDLLTIYLRLELAQQSATPTALYRNILTATYPQVAKELGIDVSSLSGGEAEAFGWSIPLWPAFPDTVAALEKLSKRYKLVILSNVDEESIAGSVKNHLTPASGKSPFYAVYTAEAIGSYKPDLKNFHYLLDKLAPELGEREKDALLHVAQSRLHDHGPAKLMGITSAWINRADAAMGVSGGEGYLWEFGSMGEFAEAVEQEK